MSRFDDIDPMNIDPDTNRPYGDYSSDSLDTSFHDGEMDVDEDESPWQEVGDFKVEHDFEDAGCGSYTRHTICAAPLGATAAEIEDDSDGFQYTESYAVAEDNGERRHLDWSRFRNYTQEHFKAFVSADFPRRTGLGPWHPQEIEALPQFGVTI